ncbi:hypothetical protein [Botrimarina sp.]|uniref:hypothetical protein n=1 Tax=Botrimarina sp. TaxID=2795802 RepID=UPI0032EF466B
MSNHTPGYYVRRALQELGFEAATTLPDADDRPTPMEACAATRGKIEPFLTGEKKLVVSDDGTFYVE